MRGTEKIRKFFDDLKSKNKKQMRRYSIVGILLSIFVFFNSCGFSDYYNGMPRFSFSIKEAKERGVFIHEYVAPSNPYIINDSLKIHIKEAWLEKIWREEKNDSTKIISEKYQIVVLSDKGDLRGNAVNWTIGTDYNRNFEYHQDFLVTKLNAIPTEEKEIWEVQKGNSFSDTGDHEIIGRFILIKK